jgi:hypothetical protein
MHFICSSNLGLKSYFQENVDVSLDDIETNIDEETTEVI